MLAETPIFYPSALDELYELNEEGENDLVQELIHDFFIQADALAKKLLSNFETKNLGEMEEAAHSLKSSSRVLGCLRLALIAERVEHFSHDGQYDGTVPFMTELAETLRATYDALKAHKKDQ